MSGDLANLGIRVTMDGVTAADQAMQGLATSAARTEVATHGATSSVEVMNVALRQQNAVTAASRAGTQQLGMQLNDFGTQVSAGINPVVAFNQQLGQVGFALSQMQGRLGAVGSFLAGPWGAAITVGLAVLSGFVMKALEHNDALDDAVKKLRDDAKESEIAARAKDIYARSAEGVRDAIREMNAELEKSITSGRQAELQTLAQARSNRQDVLSRREQIQSLIELRAEQARAQLSLAQMPNQRGEMAALGLPAAQRALAQAQADLAANAALMQEAEQAVRNAMVPVAVRAAEEMATANGRINRTYDQMRDSAIAAARGNDQLANSLTSTLSGIEAQREAALEAERARERAEAAAGRRDRASQREEERNYERLIEQSTRMRDALALERQSLGLTEGEQQRLAVAAQARKLITEGETMEAINLARALMDEKDALDAATEAYERGERIKRGTESLEEMLTRLERQAQLTGLSAESQAMLTAEWAIADLKLKEITPEMQALIDRIKELAFSNELAARHDPLGRMADDLAQIDELARRAGQGMEDAFGAAGRSISDLLTAMTGYRAELAAIADDEAKGHLTAEQAARQRAGAEADAYGSMLGAARSFFREGSDGYRIMMAIEQAYRLQQLAGMIQEMVLGKQAAAASVADSMAKGAASTAAGAAKMFEALGPLAFPAVAAMLAVLASLGLKGGSSGGAGPRLPSAANDNTSAEASTAAVRAFSARDAQSRDAAASAIATNIRLSVEASPYFDVRVQDVMEPRVVGGDRQAASSGAVMGFQAVRGSSELHQKQQRAYKR